VALLYLPAGPAGTGVVALAALAAFSLPRSQWRDVATIQWPLWFLLAWLGVTVAWTPAAADDAFLHWLRYALLGLVVVLAIGVGSRAAASALRVHVACSAMMAVLMLSGIGDHYPKDGLFNTLFHYSGNKSIGNSALMVLGAAFAAHLALQPSGSRVARAFMATAAATIVAALLLHSQSRTSVLLLGGLALVLLLGHLRDRRLWWALGLSAAAAVVVVGLGGGGLAYRAAAGHFEKSNSIRQDLYIETGRMIVDRPLTGHGLGSWVSVWQQRVGPGHSAYRIKTAHQEWLQIAQQGGVAAAMLLIGLFIRWWSLGRRWGGPGGNALVALCLTAWLLQTFVHAAIRDTRLALPMILLTGLAMAATRPLSERIPHAKCQALPNSTDAEGSATRRA
jgi:O-antigen ligase